MKTLAPNNKRAGIIFIVSAPSGTGKTTVINGLLSDFPEISLSVSYTTRAPRSGDVPGRDYHFVSSAKFATMKAQDKFAEWAKVHDFFYGTPHDPLDRCTRTARDIVLDIDVQVARQISKK